MDSIGGALFAALPAADAAPSLRRLPLNCAWTRDGEGRPSHEPRHGRRYGINARRAGQSSEAHSVNRDILD